MVLALGAFCAAGEPAKPFPLWDGKETAAQYAARVGLPQTMTLQIKDGVTLELTLIPAAKFVMGSPATEEDREDSGRMNEKQHNVTLTKPFYIAKFEVTQAQYEALIGKNPSQMKGPKGPVTNVTWDDAMHFCKVLSEKTKKSVTLPTESQWEWACRAGTTTAFNTGPTITAKQAHLHFQKGSVTQYLREVGSYPPNAFGVYDMHGNVREWCLDFRGEYDGADKVDPVGSNELKACRGGEWGSPPKWARSAFRLASLKDGAAWDKGFRVIVLVE